MRKLLAITAIAGSGMLAYCVGEKVGVENATESTLKHIYKHFPECMKEIRKGPDIVVNGLFDKYRFQFEKT